MNGSPVRFGCDPDEEGLDLEVEEEQHGHVFPDTLLEMTDLQISELSALLDANPDVVEVRPDDCICSDQSFEVNGCTCRIRRQPG